ncbi:MAG: rhomboid family intramembrane serine protease [Lachnospiraceae bacterium]|nr:rhomboid family intramembrane serine protease [Lachnospiraceae bacterium]
MQNLNSNDEPDCGQQDLQYSNIDWQEPIYVELPQDEDTVPGNKNMMICTILLIIINVIVFFQCQGIDNYTATGGASYGDIIERGEYGRLLSSMFLHIDFTHLYSNMIALFLFGKILEEDLGSFKTVFIYFISGIGSGLCSIVMHHMLVPDQLSNSVGASGAIYGIIVSYLLVAGKRAGSSKLRSTLIIVIYMVIDIALTKSKAVDIFGHLGGALTGLIITLILFCFQKQQKQEQIGAKSAGILLTVFFSLLAVQWAHLGEVPAWSAERIQFIQEAQLNCTPNISYGEALEEFCSDTSWKAFLSKKKNEVVEFHGQCYYRGKEEKIEIQFILNREDEPYIINYFSLSEESQTADEIVHFFDEVFFVYGRNHGVTVKWQ